MKNITTIQLTKATRDLLKQFGNKAETYDSILRRLMDKGLGFTKRELRIIAQSVEDQDHKASERTIRYGIVAKIEEELKR